MSTLITILALSFLIIIHELGHFLVARWSGMRVYEFSIGFGWKLWSWEWGGTIFSLLLILFGGYVRIAGMSPEEEDAKAPGSFLGSPAWKRFAMVSAGPIANYLAAFFLFAAILSIWGVRRKGVEVAQFSQGSILAQAGLRKGDIIVAVDGKPFPPRASQYSAIELFIEKLQEMRGQTVKLKIVRMGRVRELNFPFGGERLGIEVGLGNRLVVEKITAGSIAEELGLMAGDQIVAVDGKPLVDMKQFLEGLLKGFSAEGKKSDQKSVGRTISVFRKGELKKIVINRSQAQKFFIELADKFSIKVIPTLMIRSVKAGSIAQAAGLKEGDHLIQIGKTELKIEQFSSLERLFIRELSHCYRNPVEVSVLRDGQRQKFSLQGKEPADCKPEVAFLPPSWIRVVQVLPNSLAQKIGLKDGDKIIAVNEVQTLDLDTLLYQISTRLYRPISLTVLRGKKKLELRAPRVTLSKGGKIDWKLGFRPQLDFAYQKVGLAVAVSRGWNKVWDLNRRILEALVRIIRGEQKADLTGPVGIVKMASTSLVQGFRYFLFFLALISVHLAIFNLLPIPALDGGRILFIIIQKIGSLLGFKEEAIFKFEAVINVISFILLFILIILITVKDILNL